MPSWKQTKYDDLIKKYPDLLNDGFHEEFYISCREGWYDIIVNMVEAIAATKVNGRIMQIKEKFGSLRCYLDYFDNEKYHEVENIIREAENEAAITCEYCGAKPAVLRTTHRVWVRTLCDKCNNDEVTKWKQKHPDRVEEIKSDPV